MGVTPPSPLPFREAHNGPLPSASLHQFLRFYISRAAKPIQASPRPLRCFLLPVLPAIFTAKRTIESPELLRYYLDLLYKDLGDFL